MLKENYSFALTNTEKAVLKTLAYYKALGVEALTSIETKKYLISKNRATARLLDIRTALNSLKRKGILHETCGFYSLDNPHKAFNGRIKNSKASLLKWKKFKRTSAFLTYIPYIRSISITGSLALANSTKESDIDILIKSKENKIWTSRFLVTAISHILKRRRYGAKIKDRLCFNHYITVKAKAFGPPVVNRTVSSILIPVWNVSRKTGIESIFSIKTNKVLIAAKYLTEKTLDTLKLGYFIENSLGEAQIKKITSNSIGYPKELPAPEIGSDNIIFYYPKVLDTQKKYTLLYNNIYLGHSDKLGQK